MINNLEDWVETVRPIDSNGPLWGFKVYQKTLFAYEIIAMLVPMIKQQSAYK